MLAEIKPYPKVLDIATAIHKAVKTMKKSIENLIVGDESFSIKLINICC